MQWAAACLYMRPRWSTRQNRWGAVADDQQPLAQRFATEAVSAGADCGASSGRFAGLRTKARLRRCNVSTGQEIAGQVFCDLVLNRARRLRPEFLHAAWIAGWSSARCAGRSRAARSLGACSRFFGRRQVCGPPCCKAMLVARERRSAPRVQRRYTVSISNASQPHPDIAPAAWRQPPFTDDDHAMWVRPAPSPHYGADGSLPPRRQLGRRFCAGSVLTLRALHGT